MEWWSVFLIIFGSLIFIMLTGLPVAFCFLLVNVILGYILWGGMPGLVQIILSIFQSLTTFVMIPIPLFILMGEVMYRSGLVVNLLDTVDEWVGRLPGRLSLVAVAGGAILSSLTGNSMGSTAMLGSTLMPEMMKRGYQKPMTIGPIVGSGGLAIMIPPSSLAVFLGAIAEISIGKLLIGIIIPGLLMAALYAIYIVGRCKLQPSLAPPYEVSYIPFSKKNIGFYTLRSAHGCHRLSCCGSNIFGDSNSHRSGSYRLSWRLYHGCSIWETALGYGQNYLAAYYYAFSYGIYDSQWCNSFQPDPRLYGSE